MKTNENIQVILQFLILVSAAVSLTYFGTTKVVNESYGEIVLKFNDRISREYHKYLLNFYTIFIINLIASIITLVLLIVSLALYFSEIKINKMVGFILSILMLLMLIVYSGIAFTVESLINFHNLRECPTKTTHKYFDFIYLNEIKSVEREFRSSTDSLIKDITQADKLQNLIDMCRVSRISSFISAGLFGLLFLTKVY
jgi:hypothetical protein